MSVAIATNTTALPTTTNKANTIQACSNVRYTYAGCSHVYLARCSLHPVNESSRWSCACPNPQASFTAFEHSTSCPSCRFKTEQAQCDYALATLIDTKTEVAQAVAENCAARLKVTRLYLSVEEKMELGMRFVEEGKGLQERSRRAIDEVRDCESKKLKLWQEAVECEDWERIGTWVQCQGQGKQRLMIWFTCEDDSGLWKWGM